MQPITLRRYSAGSYVDGVWVDGLATDTTVQASVQPLSTSDFRLLPEGDRGKKSWKIFSNFELSMGNDDGIKADEIIVNNILYRISSPDDYHFFGHTEAIFIEATE